MACCDKLRTKVSLLIGDVVCVVVRLFPYESSQVEIVVFASYTVYELLELGEPVNVTFAAHLSKGHPREISVYFLILKKFPSKDLHANV